MKSLTEPQLAVLRRLELDDALPLHLLIPAMRGFDPNGDGAALRRFGAHVLADLLDQGLVALDSTLPKPRRQLARSRHWRQSGRHWLLSVLRTGRPVGVTVTPAGSDTVATANIVTLLGYSPRDDRLEIARDVTGMDVAEVRDRLGLAASDELLGDYPIPESLTTWWADRASVDLEDGRCWQARPCRQR